MRTLTLVSFLAMLSLSARANVFGKDDRELMPKTIYNSQPFARIVKVEKCTGALVGPNLVLTAYHCVDHQKKRNGKYSNSFDVSVARYGLFFSADRSKVIDMVHGGESGTENDWAVLVLDKNLGSKYGFFKVQDHVNFNYAVNLFGFSADINNHKPSFHANCQIRQINEATFYHDCDSTGGASGAPIWKKEDNGEYVIVGIHIGGKRKRDEGHISVLKTEAYSHAEANIGVLPLNFYNEIYERLP